MNYIKNIIKYGEAETIYEKKKYKSQNPNLRILFWETTLRCNALCKHCGSRAGEKNKYNDELTTDEIKQCFKTISQKMDSSKIFLNITGGEPLLREDLFDVMKYAKNLGFGWSMTTNGTLIDSNMVAKLKEAGLTSVSISIDGTEHTHDEFRGVKGYYNKSINAIKLLRDANFLDVLQITTVVNKNNINELEDLYKIISDLHVDSWRIMNIDPIGRARDNKDLELDKDEYKYLIHFIEQKRKKSKFDVTSACTHYFGIKHEKETRCYMFQCIAGTEVGSILYNGDIFVCPNVERRPELIQGNIRKDDFCDIWKNKFEIFRDLDRYKKCKECNECEDAKYCLGESLHTWNFDENKPNICMNKILNT